MWTYQHFYYIGLFSDLSLQICRLKSENQ